MGWLYKLKKIRNELLKWLRNYLHDKKLCRNQWSKSDIGRIKTEVRQESIMWTFTVVFLIYINDLVTNIKCIFKHFADDTPLYIVVYNADTSVCRPNNDLEQIHKCSIQWLVSFNTIII